MIAFFYTRNVPTAQIRAVQIADYLGAEQHPPAIPETGVCITIKCNPSRIGPERNLTFPDDRTVYDLVDQHQALSTLKVKPHMPVIVASKSALQMLRGTHENELFLIPQQHCNPDRELRPPRPVVTVGYIGEKRQIEPVIEELRDRLFAAGMALRTEFQFPNRESVHRFYQQVDLQLVWRLELPPEIAALKTPLKVVNAGSYGIPTVAQPEVSLMAEVAGSFVPARTLAEAVDALAFLRDTPAWYAEMAGCAQVTAEKYHVSKVLPLYRELEARWM